MSESGPLLLVWLYIAAVAQNKFVKSLRCRWLKVMSKNLSLFKKDTKAWWKCHKSNLHVLYVTYMLLFTDNVFFQWASLSNFMNVDISRFFLSDKLNFILFLLYFGTLGNIANWNIVKWSTVGKKNIWSLLILYVCPLTKKWSVYNFNGRFIWTVRDRNNKKIQKIAFSKNL